MADDLLFLTLASGGDLPAARLTLESLRSFGGEYASAPAWVLTPEPEALLDLEDDRTLLQPLEVPPRVAGWFLGSKVAACARAEQLAPAGIRTLVWLDAGVLVVRPPQLFHLGSGFDAAFRPVHIRNVGLPPSQPLDAFWGGIYAAVGVPDVRLTVTSFVDDQVLRLYFNTHAFALNPALGLMQRWYSLFQHLLADDGFLSSACADEVHQVFLFQALLSALVAVSIPPDRLRLLPPDYNYPYHMQERIPPGHRVAWINDLVTLTYEERDIRPSALAGIDVREPLRSWLAARLGG